MLTPYLFNRRRGTKLEEWAESFRGLSKDEVLWVDLTAPSEDEAREASEVLGLRGGLNLHPAERKPSLVQQDGYLALTAVAVSDNEREIENERVVLQCFVGRNWLLTAHSAKVAVIDEFRETAAGEGELGTLDAQSFLATLLEWVVNSYLRVFDEIEAELENFDVEALTAPSRDPEARIKLLIEARQRVGGCAARLPRTERCSPLSATPSSICSPPRHPANDLSS